MAGNTFGKLFKITTFGESHGPLIGVVIDGCPSNIVFDNELLYAELDKRKPGQSDITTNRNESDLPEIVSGVFENKTTGAPITILIKNIDAKSNDYLIYKDLFRPSHADFTYWKKYSHYDYRGGGRSSARETAVRVAAGAVAKMILKETTIEIQTFTSQIGHLKLNKHYSNYQLNLSTTNKVKCPDIDLAYQMETFIQQIKSDGDSIGGIVSCVIRNCPAGLGEPVFDKLEADLAKAMLSINASKGFEIGSGFDSAQLKGSENNDFFTFNPEKGVFPKQNNSGGVLGGISTAEDIYFNVAFKPTSTIEMNENFITKEGKEIILKNKKGRHDPCIVPRAVQVVESMAAIVLADHYLLSKTLRN